MLSGTKRRMANLERSIQVPMTPEGFLTRVEELSRLTGVSSDEAFDSVVVSLNPQDLDRLAEEFTQRACGDDVEKRAEVMRLAVIFAAESV